MKDRKLLGKLGENMAAGILYAEGFDVLERNFTSYYGEADLICEKGDVIWFVEVKTRMSGKFGAPAEAVDGVKQRRIRKTAEYYMMKHGRGKYAAFKVMEILVRETDDDFGIG